MSDPAITPEDLDEQEFDQGGLRSVLAYTSERVTYVQPTMTLREVAAVLHGSDVSLVVVGDASSVHGVITERDIVRAVSSGLDVDVELVGSVETDELIWAPPSANVNEVAETMLENYVRHLLIGDGLGALVGVVSMRDLLTAYLV